MLIGIEELYFNVIKSILASSTTRVHDGPSLHICMPCDASSVGVGAVLGHILPDRTELPIRYASRTLSSPESKCAIIDK